MHDIALINPPSPFLINQKAVPPLGLLYIGAYLREKGYAVRLVDLADRSVLDLYYLLPQAKHYGITTTTAQYNLALEIKDAIKKKYPGSLVILGGHHASARAVSCKDDGFDAVVRGEGERATERILQGLIFDHVWMPPVRSLDTFPMPAWDMIDMKSYGYNFGHGPAASLITSRGCSWSRCAFCASTTVFKGVRFHSEERVLKEVEALMVYGFRAVQFLDDAFTGNPERLEKICHLIAPLSLKWRCYSRAGISRELLECMRSAGCVEIGFGAESGSQAILDRVCKGTKVEDNTRFVYDCEDIGITVQAFIVVGLPGETPMTIHETMDWFERAAPDKFGLNIFIPLPGSPIGEQPEKHGICTRDMGFRAMAVKVQRPEDARAVARTREMDFLALESAYRMMMRRMVELTGFRPGVTNG